MRNRIKYLPLQDRVVSSKEAAAVIQNGMTVAFGGYTSSGYPKAVARELAERKKTEKEFKIFMLSGSVNGYLETLLGDAKILSGKAPMIESRSLAKLSNEGKIRYVEQQMNKMPELVAQGAFGKIDVAVVEALRITKEGGIVPTSSIGLLPSILQYAEKIIVEINMAQPAELEELHDIYIPKRYPGREPIPLVSVNQRIGISSIPVDPEKICCIVESEELDDFPEYTPANSNITSVVERLLEFLETECKRNYGGKLPPVQTGFGNLANEIARGLGNSKFRELEFFCGGMQESSLALIAEGKVKAASTGSIQMTSKVQKMLKEHWKTFRDTTVIRNIDVTNTGEVIHRLGVFALNSAIEMDIYGNVNSSHITGSRVVNGLGGGANFAQNAQLSVMLMVSENKKGAISTIVPMVSHQDISEHDIDVVVTENGIADLRGKDDIERAYLIIQNCASPLYRPLLSDYIERAIKENGGHHPQNPHEAFEWHRRFKEHGTMLINP